MPSPFGVSAANQAQLGGPGVQDTTQLLQKIMFGRIVGAPAFPYGGVSAKVHKARDSQVDVLVDDWDKTNTHTFTANYEPRPQASNVPPWPPGGHALLHRLRR